MVHRRMFPHTMRDADYAYGLLVRCGSYTFVDSRVLDKACLWRISYSNFSSVALSFPAYGLVVWAQTSFDCIHLYLQAPP